MMQMSFHLPLILTFYYVQAQIHVVTVRLPRYFTIDFQVIRVLGLLGALDPHRHKQNLGLIQESDATAVLSMSDSKNSQEMSQIGK